MKKNLLLLLLLLSAHHLRAQWGSNIVMNPGFETGPVPASSSNATTILLSTNAPGWDNGCVGMTFPNGFQPGNPDVFDPSSPACSADPQYSVHVPLNKWTTLSAFAGVRYAGFNNEESLMGTLTEMLSPGCIYKISITAAEAFGLMKCSGMNMNTSKNMFFTIWLRDSSNPCGGSELLWTSPVITSNSWTTLSSEITASATSNNYDLFEIKLETNDSIFNTAWANPMLLDEVSIQKFTGPLTISSTATTICSGQQLTLTGNYGTWSVVSGDTDLTDPDSLEITVSPNVTTEYQLTYGCMSETITIHVNALPVINLGSDTAFCTPVSMLLNAGTGYTNYAWTQPPPGGCFSGSNQMYPCHTGTYTVTVTDSNGCTGSDTINVMVNQSPIISLTSSPSTACVGDLITLTVNTSFCSGCTFVWNPSSLSGNPASTVLTAPTTYAVTATNNSGCASYTTVNVGINPNCINDNYCNTVRKPWNKDYGSESVNTADGGFISIGTLYGTSAGQSSDRDIYVIKYNSAGTVDWGRRFGNPNGVVELEDGISIITATDGYYILGNKRETAGTAFVVAKLDLSGAQVWSKLYMHSDNFSDQSCKLLADYSGGLVSRLYVIGSTNRLGSSNNDVFAMALNPSGTVLQFIIYQGSTPGNGDEIATDACLVPGGRIAISGEHVNAGNKNVLLYLVPSDLSSTGITDMVFGGTATHEGAYAIEYANNELLLTGYRRPVTQATTGNDLLLIRVPVGIPLVPSVKLTYAGAVNIGEEGKSIRVVDGNFVIAGSSLSGTTKNILLTKLNSASPYNAIWATGSQAPGINEFLNDVILQGTHLLGTGAHDVANISGIAGDEDMLLTRFNSSGVSCCTQTQNLSPTAFNDVITHTIKYVPSPATSMNYSQPSAYNETLLICESAFRFADHNDDVITGDGPVLYPNPNNGLFSLCGLTDGDVELMLFDLSGRITSTQHLSTAEGNATVDFTGITPGVYLLQIKQDGNILNKKIVFN